MSYTPYRYQYNDSLLQADVSGNLFEAPTLDSRSGGFNLQQVVAGVDYITVSQLTTKRLTHV